MPANIYQTIQCSNAPYGNSHVYCFKISVNGVVVKGTEVNNPPLIGEDGLPEQVQLEVAGPFVDWVPDYKDKMFSVQVQNGTDVQAAITEVVARFKSQQETTVPTVVAQEVIL